MNFNERLKRKRIESNFTQEALAEKLHVTRQAVSRWERGITEPDMATLQKISKCLNWPVHEMINQPETKKKMNWKKIILMAFLCLCAVSFHFIIDPLIKEQASRYFQVEWAWRYRLLAVPAFYLLAGAFFSSFFEHVIPALPKVAIIFLLPISFYYIYVCSYSFFQITLFQPLEILLWIIEHLSFVDSMMIFEGILLNLICRKRGLR